MADNDDIISIIRQLYSLIFSWHKEQGQAGIDALIRSNKIWNRDDDNVKEYKAALEEMPPPADAGLDDIYLVARKARSGILELNYGAGIGNGMNLGEAAGKIIYLYEEIKKRERLESIKDTVFAITDDGLNDEGYFKKAMDIYKDVLLDNEKNLGGRIALADTNWEVQKAGGSKENIFFRKPAGLNLKEIEEEDNLFHLAMNGKVSIILINVK